MPLADSVTAHLGEFVPPLVACYAYLFLYCGRAARLARQGRPVPRWRMAMFVSGVVLMTAVQVGPLDTLADDVLYAHMLQHIVIGDIASLLIVLGLTGPLLAPLLRIRPTRPLRVLAHPAVALVLWGVDMYAWHSPLLYQLAVRHDLVHALEHACFLWFGTLLWLALIGPLPKPRWFAGFGRLAYVVGVRLLGGILGNILLWDQALIYPVYRASDTARGLNPMTDQRIAGTVMMIEQILLTNLIFGWLFFRFLLQAEQRQRLLDLAGARGIPLSEERAGRAAAAGAAARLGERVLAERAEAGPSAAAGSPPPRRASAPPPRG